jgi:hypothetical protein
MEIDPMHLTKVKPETGNPKIEEKKTCQICFIESKNNKLIVCPVNNNCDYTMCMKCIGKEKQRLMELDENITRMICPACRVKWPFDDSITAEQVRRGREGDCPYYCICITSDNCNCRVWCVKNLNHPLHSNRTMHTTIQNIVAKKNMCIKNLKFLKKKFFEQVELIRFLQIVLLSISFRAIFDIYACAIPNVKIDTSENDWCEPFLTPWFVVLSFVGLILFIFSVFAIILASMILMSFLHCLCGEDDRYA